MDNGSHCTDQCMLLPGAPWLHLDALHVAAPAHLDAPCRTNPQPTSLAAAFLPPYTTRDGSLNDIIQFPFEYHNILQGNQPFYNALLLEDEQPLLMHQPSHIPSPPHQQNTHKQQLPPPLMNFNYETPCMASPLLAPVPPHTRRPPLHKGTTAYREAHILSERQRRQEMAHAFSRLRSLLPNMQDNNLQGDRCTILGKVIKYVQDLDKKVQELGKVKAHLMEEQDKRKVKKQEESVSICTSNVTVRQWGNFDVFITLSCPKQRGLWPNLLALLEDTLQLDVQNVALSSTPLFCVHSIYAKVATKKDHKESCKILQERLGSFVATHTYNNIWR